MNTPEHQPSELAPITARRVRRLSILLVLITLIVAGLACGKSKPTATSEQPKPPQPTHTKRVEATQTRPKPTDTEVPTAAPTSTEIVGLKTIVDDGSPLAPQIIEQQRYRW
jgi:hypothetical protein